MFKPLGPRVVVRQLEAARTSKGGLIIPEMGQERPMEAEVLAVGTEVLDEEIKVGRRIYFSRFGGVKVRLSDFSGVSEEVEELIILKEGELLGVFL